MALNNEMSGHPLPQPRLKHAYAYYHNNRAVIWGVLLLGITTIGDLIFGLL